MELDVIHLLNMLVDAFVFDNLLAIVASVALMGMCESIGLCKVVIFGLYLLNESESPNRNLSCTYSHVPKKS